MTPCVCGWCEIPVSIMCGLNIRRLPEESNMSTSDAVMNRMASSLQYARTGLKRMVRSMALVTRLQ